MELTTERSRRRGSVGRRILIRLGAVTVALALLIALELSLSLMGWGTPTPSDPFVGFSPSVPLFELDQVRQRYVVSPSRRGYFAVDSFPAVKPSGEIRIFCLGGSTVQGRPYSIETAFSSWLELNLKSADPSHPWDVINCGGVSYASYRLLPIMREVLQYQPDLIVLYTGHNEFLEERTYGQIKRTAPVAAWMHQQLCRLRIYNVMRTAVNGAGRPNRNGTELPAEVDAILDYQDGLRAYHRDDRWRQAVVRDFESNLRQLIQLAADQQVPVLLLNPAADIRGTPPFKSQHRDGLDERQIARFHALWRQAKLDQEKDPSRALDSLDQAIRIDDRFASVHFRRGRCLEPLGRFADARAAYLRAKEEDVCPLRVLEPMQDAVLRVAQASGTPLVDVRQLFDQASPHGLPGEELFVDHVHPTFRGHQLIAEALCQEMVRQGMLAPRPGYEPARDALYGQQFQSLPVSYFERGKQRLRGLQRWTEGRAKKVRGEVHGNEPE